MVSNRSLLHFSILFLVIGLASSSYISNEAFEAKQSMGRSLLQQKTECTVDFEQLNYTVITSQCKGPNYSKDRCCSPLKQLMCPIKDQINDLKSNCADTFFSYVNLYGKYPPGVFAALCVEAKQGLDCTGVDTEPPKPHENAASMTIPHHSISLIIALPLLVLFYM